MTTDALIATAFARIDSMDQTILYADERTGDDCFERDLASAAIDIGRALYENEDGDLCMAG